MSFAAAISNAVSAVPVTPAANPLKAFKSTGGNDQTGTGSAVALATNGNQVFYRDIKTALWAGNSKRASYVYQDWANPSWLKANSKADTVGGVAGFWIDQSLVNDPNFNVVQTGLYRGAKERGGLLQKVFDFTEPIHDKLDPLDAKVQELVIGNNDRQRKVIPIVGTAVGAYFGASALLGSSSAGASVGASESATASTTAFDLSGFSVPAASTTAQNFAALYPTGNFTAAAFDSAFGLTSAAPGASSGMLDYLKTGAQVTQGATQVSKLLSPSATGANDAVLPELTYDTLGNVTGQPAATDPGAAMPYSIVSSSGGLSPLLLVVAGLGVVLFFAKGKK